jgi:hypothetical protein
MALFGEPFLHVLSRKNWAVKAIQEFIIRKDSSPKAVGGMTFAQWVWVIV